MIRRKFQVAMVAGALSVVGAHTEPLMVINFDEASDDAFDQVGGHSIKAENLKGVVGRSADNPFHEKENRSLELDASLVEPGVGCFLAKPETIGSKGDTLTMEGWIKPGKDADMTLLQAWTSGSKFYAIIGVGKTPDGQSVEPMFILHGAKSGETEGPGVEYTRRADPVALDEWTHIALTYGAHELEFYVNGKLVYSEKNVEISVPEHMDQFHFGAGGLGNITGKIDDLRWSDEKLPREQLGFSKSFSGQ